MTGDFASRSNNSNISTTTSAKNPESKMTTASLGGFLDTSDTAATTTKTVAGESAETEIYIRADGKKVRRIKKKVVRTISAASTVAEGDTKAKLKDFMTQNSSNGAAKIPKGAMSVDGAMSSSNRANTFSEGEVYINKDGKKVRRVKRTASSASTVAPSSAAGDLSGLLEKGSPSNRKLGSSATVAGDIGVEGEIYLNKDGKKVRRVRRTGSASVAPPTSASKVTSGAASVVGDGEIYINKDGKKVRRVKRSESQSAAASTTTDSLGGFLGKSAPPASKSNKLSSDSSLSSFLGKSKSKKKKGSSNNSLSSFLSKSKSKKKKGSSNSSLGSFLGKSKSKTKKVSGSATVAGSTPTKNKSLEEVGEIYINKDGKKVRRVKKSKAGSATVTGDFMSTSTSSTANKTASLSGLLGSRKPVAKGSAATVAGDRVAKSHDEEGEIYIRPDGKKVRRIRKTKSPSGAASVDDSCTQDGEVYINKDGKKVRRVRKAKTEDSLGGFLGNNSAASSARAGSGSATVAGSTPSKSNTFSEGEIYIRPDGKKVRRVRKTTSSASLSVATTSAAGDLASGESTAGGRKPGDAATVAGERVVKQVPEGEIVIRADGKKVLRRKKTPSVGSGGSQSLESEVYRRADGKLVRRVKRTASTQSVPSTTTAKTLPGDLAGYMETKANTSKPNKHISETATVVGDGPAPSIADLLKSKQASPTTVSTRELSSTTTTTPPPPPPAAAAAPVPTHSSTQKENVSSLTDTTRQTAEQLTVESVSTNVNAAVLGTPSTTQTQPEERKEPKETAEPTPAASSITTSSSIQLSEDDEAIATSFMKMKRMGLPDDAVKHKMDQDGVDAKIIAYVLGVSYNDGSSTESSPSLPAASVALSPAPVKSTPAPAPVVASVPAPVVVSPPSPVPTVSTPAPATSSIQLSGDEEAIASSYAKMKRMGLPDDAVKHKMNQDDVDPKIIAYVLGEPWNDMSQSSADASPSPAPAPVSAPDVPLIQLSSDEEAVASSYTRMKRMGLPDDAIKHKMTQDGVDPKIMAFVLGEPWTGDLSEQSSSKTAPAQTSASLPPSAPLPAPSSRLSPDEDAVASSYTKMKKMGLPEDAIRHKMAQDGVDPKIMAFVLGEPWNDSSPASGPATRTILLSPNEEAVASSYTKMKKMGLPDDAIKHKMTQDSVDPKIMAFVLDEPWEGDSSAQQSETVGIPFPEPIAPVIRLTDEEEAIASQYRKMLTMGLPKDAVRHKLLQDGIAGKICAAVLEEPWKDPHAVTEKKATFNLVMSEDEAAKNEKPSALAAALSGRPTLKRQNSSETVATVHPHEKFAVKLDNAGSEADANAEVEMKYMTLDDIARLSGQSRDELEKMIVDRRNNDQQIPRFVLQPMEKSKKPVAVPLFPVQITKGEPHAAVAPAEQTNNPVVANPALANADPNHLKEVKDGEEVVDSALANAARAVAALGENDMSSLLAKLQAGDMGKLLEKLQEAEKRQKKLEKQLAQAGVAIAEDIDYSEAKTQVEKIAKRMNEIGGSDIVLPDKEEQNRLREEYFKLEQQMERYNTALMLTEEYQAEQDRLEQQWEADNAAPNLEALKKIRRHMPVKIRHMSEAELTNTPSPNGKFLPKSIAKKFKRTNVLQMLRLNPDDIERMHPSTLESMRVTGLTLTERRALYLHLKPIGPKWEKNKAEKMTERKWTWYKMMKNNFKENLAPYLRHVAEYGPPENHPYATRDNPNGGCPLIGKQCPIKADKLVDYDGDYGWTEAAEYEVSQVTKSDADDPGAKAMQEALELAREKKANERADLLKKHYKGKLLQVSKANGSCEAMDESMDKAEYATMRWIEYIIEKGEDESDADKKKEVANFNTALNELKLSVLDFCQRSGMQISGKKKAGGDGADIRSAVECGLAEEVYEVTQELFRFIRGRMKDINQRDTRVEKTIELLEAMLTELHNKNVATLQKLGVKRPDRSRKLRKNEDMRKEVEDKMKPKDDESTPAAEEEAAPMGPPGGGGRGDLMSAISGRGRGGGRGDLMSAISGRGRGRGGGRGGGRGDLMAAISGRGRGGGDAAGGRGGLLAAIQGRGGGRGGGDAGGRGGLLAAIQARGGD